VVRGRFQPGAREEGNGDVAHQMSAIQSDQMGPTGLFMSHKMVLAREKRGNDAQRAPSANRAGAASAAIAVGNSHLEDLAAHDEEQRETTFEMNRSCRDYA